MSGELYRAKMRFIHRFLGYCWPQQSGPDPDRVWCHWCGMRGIKINLQIPDPPHDAGVGIFGTKA